MAELIVITGPPGAGKSTVARLVADAITPSAVVPGDQFFGFLARGYVDPWKTEADQQNVIVTEAAALAAGRLVEGGYFVVYDGIVGSWFLNLFLTTTGLSELHYAVLLPPEELCLSRIATRSGHGFTDHDAGRHMYREFSESAVDRRHLLTAVDSPTALAGLIAERVAAGSLLVRRTPGTQS